MAKDRPDFCMRCPVGGTFNDIDQTCSAPDPQDGLPLVCVGEWAEQKHARIRKYVDISRAVRRKFVEGKGGATYIDLFSGPGRARVRETTRIIDGSAVIAAKEAIESQTPFSELHIADLNESFLSAAVSRLDKLGVTTKAYAGTSEDAVGQITAVLPKFGLHFAFLDPYDLKSLPFSIIEKLATFKRMDILIHVSAQDLQRNLRRYIESSQSPLDSFAPRWRLVIDKMDRDANIRSRIFLHWLGLIRGRDMQPAQGVEDVTGIRNQHLYWLVFVARHNLALRFWEGIRNVTDQKSLGFYGD
jgi:three-Cys-motif partner protein